MRLSRFETTIAWRFLREGRFQSVLLVVGVAAGVAVIAYIATLIAGMQANTIRRTLGIQPHLVFKAPDDAARPVLPRDGPIRVLGDVQPRAQRLRSVDDWASLVAVLDRDPELLAVSPMVSGSGLAVRGEASQAIALVGVDVARYSRIVSLHERLTDGRLDVGPGEAVIGIELATQLGVRIGDRIAISTAAGSTGNRQETLRVIGLIDLGIRDMNRRTVIVTLRAAQTLVDLPGGVSQIDATVRDVFGAEAIARRQAARTGLEVQSWMATNAQLLSALNAQSVSTTLIRGAVMMVVLLGIASVLVVAVVQKQREIGILRAMGATRGQILRVFLLQGLIIGAAGSVLGAGLALAMVELFVTFVRGADGGPLFMVAIEPMILVSVAATASLAGVAAAALPARRAARLDPATAIRS